MFAAEGFDRARMESIAARAGVAVGTIYNYFEDREALLAALVESRRAALLVRLDAAAAEGAGRPFEEAIAGFLRAWFDHWATHRGLLSLLFHAGLGRSTRGRGAIVDEVTRRAEAVLARGRSEGKVAPDEDGLQAALLVGLVWGALMRDLIREGGAAGASPAEPVLEMFLRGAGR